MLGIIGDAFSLVQKGVKAVTGKGKEAAKQVAADAARAARERADAELARLRADVTRLAAEKSPKEFTAAVAFQQFGGWIALGLAIIVVVVVLLVVRRK